MTSVKETLKDTPLMAEVHPSFNSVEEVGNYTLGSHKDVIWACSANSEHIWTVSVRVRAKLNTGCPYCAGKKVHVSESLLTTHPAISEQYDNVNNVLKSNEISASSNKEVAWVNLECNHTWKQSVKKRLALDETCPVCSNLIIVEGYNSIFDIYPLLREQWSSKNTVKPEGLSFSSHKKIIWLCGQGHEYETSVRNKIKQKTCPVCRGRVLISGVNDVATIYPHIVEIWSKKNVNQPENIVFNSADMIIFDEVCGHSYSSSIDSRLSAEGCLICAGKIVAPGVNTLADTHPALAAEWSENNDLKPAEVTYGSAYHASWICDKGHSWNAYVYARTRGSGCPQCAASAYSSAGEEDLAATVRALVGDSVEIVFNDRSALQGSEIDIYIPVLKIGIEYNGLYWHSDMSGKGRDYHSDKYAAAKEAGLQLIQIWEDDWSNRRAIVIKMLANKLNSPTPNVYKALGEDESFPLTFMARKLNIMDVEYAQAAEFLEKNHIQGSVTGTIYKGLADENNILRALLVATRLKDGIYTIVRYATSDSVPGGFTKLLKAVERNQKVTAWETFSDNCISDGGLYSSNGFFKAKELREDYSYVVDKQRVHKFNYRVSRFRTDDSLTFHEGLSERELAQLNNIPRVWDAGKIKWVKFVDKS